MHEFLTEEEIAWMIDYSTPRLTRERETTGALKAKYEAKNKKKRKTVHKTVQVRHDAINHDTQKISILNLIRLLGAYLGAIPQ